MKQDPLIISGLSDVSALNSCKSGLTSAFASALGVSSSEVSVVGDVSTLENGDAQITFQYPNTVSAVAAISDFSTFFAAFEAAAREIDGLNVALGYSIFCIYKTCYTDTKRYNTN